MAFDNAILPKCQDLNDRRSIQQCSTNIKIRLPTGGLGENSVKPEKRYLRSYNPVIVAWASEWDFTSFSTSSGGV